MKSIQQCTVSKRQLALPAGAPVHARCDGRVDVPGAALRANGLHHGRLEWTGATARARQQRTCIHLGGAAQPSWRLWRFQSSAECAAQQ
jgi:hypothetical protein